MSWYAVVGRGLLARGLGKKVQTSTSLEAPVPACSTLPLWLAGHRAGLERSISTRAELVVTMACSRPHSQGEPLAIR